MYKRGFVGAEEHSLIENDAACAAGSEPFEDVLKEEDLKGYDREIRQLINRAAEFATDSPEPPPEELYTDILK